MDEQLLRARMHALDQANLALNYSGMTYGGDVADIAPAVQTLAETFEAWLTRSAPVDVSKADDGAAHRSETMADRLGYQRCPTTWHTEDGAGHLCIYPPGHEDFPRVEHRCSCSAVLDASTTER